MPDSERLSLSKFRKVMLLGAPRSGTTWLAKIFDSHSDVIYRHEPDSVQPNYSFPFMINADETDEFVDAARQYLDALCLQRSIRSVGKRPLFKKSFNSPNSHLSRNGMITLLQFGSKIPILGDILGRVQIPDFIFQNSAQACTYVIKSVISLGRAGLYQKAMTDGHIVFIVRHPCGFVASELRGFKNKKLQNNIAIQALASAKQSEHYGLTVERLAQLDIVEQLAWVWTILNEKALTDLGDHENVTIVNHDELCNNPRSQTERIFSACGLSWDSQTELFLAESSSYQQQTSYYGVRRNSAVEAGKWREELDEDVVQRILGITKNTPPGQLFF